MPTYSDYTFEYVGIKKSIEKKLERLLAIFPYLVILGARQCGKTYLS